MKQKLNKIRKCPFIKAPCMKDECIFYVSKAGAGTQAIKGCAFIELKESIKHMTDIEMKNVLKHVSNMDQHGVKVRFL